MLDETAKQKLISFAKRLNDAKHGTKQGIINEALEYFSWSTHHKLYAELAKLGWAK